MKKMFFFFLGSILFINVCVFGEENKFVLSPEADELVKDQEFSEVINLMVDFSVRIVKQNKFEAIKKYVETKASGNVEIPLLFESKGTDINSTFVSKIAFLKRSLEIKYSFLVDNEKGRKVFTEAVNLLIIEKKIKKIQNVDTDCLAAYMASIGICWWAYDQCTVDYSSTFNSKCWV